MTVTAILVTQGEQALGNAGLHDDGRQRLRRDRSGRGILLCRRWQRRIGGGSRSGGGQGRRRVEEESGGVGADQKPNGSRLSGKEQLGHPPGDQTAKFWKTSQIRVGKYTKGANVGAIRAGGSKFQVVVVDRPSPKDWRVCGANVTLSARVWRCELRREGSSPGLSANGTQG